MPIAASLAAAIENQFGLQAELIEGHNGIYEIAIYGMAINGMAINDKCLHCGSYNTNDL